MPEVEINLEPSGYQMVKDTDDSSGTIYLYDAGGDKLDWRRPGDEGYQDWNRHFEKD